MSLALLLQLAAPAVAATDPSPTEIAAAWAAGVPALQSAGAIPITLGDTDFSALASGLPVARRTNTEAGAFVSGAILIPQPVDVAWVAIQDAIHDPEGNPMQIEWLPGATNTTRRIYMHLPLPWPMADRQWVCDMRSNAALYSASSGQLWQRTWDVADPGLAPTPDPKGVWVDENSGAWTLLDLGESTLAVFTARTVLGGSIPESISTGWAVRTLSKSLEQMVIRSERMPAHYDGTHDPVYRPDGAPIGAGFQD